MSAADAPPPRRSHWARLLHSDDAPLRLLFGGLVAVAALVLAQDYTGIGGHLAQFEQTHEPATASPDAEITPAAETSQAQPQTVLGLQWPDAMRFELVAGGRLMAVGTIVPGTATAFAAELAKRGGYIRTVVLNSRGGAVVDAMAMGREIRARRYATEVTDDASCLSSCPLVFAGGIERRAGERATIGVHQVTPLPQEGLSALDAVEATEKMLAQCQHYLHDMGVDLAVWMHAQDTPRNLVYRFTLEQMRTLRLTTDPRDADRSARAAHPESQASAPAIE